MFTFAQKQFEPFKGKLEKPEFGDGGRVFPVRFGKNALSVDKWPLGHKWPNY